jgi:hypothetical protein
MMTLPSTQEPIVANRSFVDFSSVMQSVSFEREVSFCFGSPLVTDYSAHSPFYSIVSRVGLLIILCRLQGSARQRCCSSFFRKVRHAAAQEMMGGPSKPAYRCRPQKVPKGVYGEQPAGEGSSTTGGWATSRSRDSVMRSSITVICQLLTRLGQDIGSEKSWIL